MTHPMDPNAITTRLSCAPTRFEDVGSMECFQANCVRAVYSTRTLGAMAGATGEGIQPFFF